MTSRLRRWGAPLLLLTLSIAFALAIGEIAARVLYPRVRATSWYRYDPRYGFRHRASRSVLSSEWGDGQPWRVVTNAHGFRGDEWTWQQPDGTRRVLFAGDSFTFGNGVADEHTLPVAVETTLAERDASWQVVNLGTSGWGPQNVIAWLRTEGAALEASCLVYVFYDGNDAMDSFAHALYVIDGDTLVRRAPPAPSTSLRISRFIRQFPPSSWLLEHSQLVNVARNAVRNRLAARGELSPDQQLYSAPTPAQIDSALEASGAALDALRTLALHRFGAFGILLLPTPEQVFGSTPEREPLSSPELARRTHDAVLAWAADAQVPVLDLEAAWRADPEPARAFYFRRDFHLTPEGNRAAGTAAAVRLPELCRGAG